MPATKRALLDACTGSWLLLMSLDATVFSLAQLGGLVNRQKRRAFGIVLDRMQVADSLTRQLQRLGLERKAKPVPDLAEYLRGRYGSARARVAGQDEGVGDAPAPEEGPHDGDGAP